MFKKLKVVLFFIPSLAISATQYNGVYRDNNFNLAPHQGIYSCKIYPSTRYPKVRVDQKSIGDANLSVENSENGIDKRISVDLNNGLELNSTTKLMNKGSTKSMYGMTHDELTVIYSITEDMGSEILIQTEGDRDNLTVVVSSCYMVRNHDMGAPADP